MVFEAEKQSRRRQEQLEERIEKMTAQVEEQRRALQEEERKTRELSSQIKQSEKALQESHAREERLSGEITENEQEMTRLRTEINTISSVNEGRHGRSRQALL